MRCHVCAKTGQIHYNYILGEDGGKEMFCEACGNEVAVGAKFCPSCGAEVSKSAETISLEKSSDVKTAADHNGFEQVNSGQNSFNRTNNGQNSFSQASSNMQMGNQYQNTNQGTAQGTNQGSGMTANTAILLSYILGLLGIIIAYCTVSMEDKNSEFFKYHMNNCVWILILNIIGWMLLIFIIGFIPLIFAFVCWIMGLISTLNHTMYQIPLVSNLRIIK